MKPILSGDWVLFTFPMYRQRLLATPDLKRILTKKGFDKEGLSPYRKKAPWSLKELEALDLAG